VNSSYLLAGSVGPGATGPLIPPEKGMVVVTTDGVGSAVVVVVAGAGVVAGLVGWWDWSSEHAPVSTATNATALIHEARLTLLEVGGDGLDLVGRADERADRAFLGLEAVGQADRAGQVEQCLGAPHGVG
jgi:hypothetical protein